MLCYSTTGSVFKEDEFHRPFLFVGFQAGRNPASKIPNNRAALTAFPNFCPPSIASPRGRQSTDVTYLPSLRQLRALLDAPSLKVMMKLLFCGCRTNTTQAQKTTIIKDFSCFVGLATCEADLFSCFIGLAKCEADLF